MVFRRPSDKHKNLYAWGLHIDASHDVFKTDIPVLKNWMDIILEKEKGAN